jgi:putative membrane protein
MVAGMVARPRVFYPLHKEAVMIHHIIHLAVFALAVLIAARVVPGIRVKSFGSAFIFAVVLAILNKLLFGVLVFLSLPFVLVSFGLFLLVINAFLFWLADKIVAGVELDGFGAAILGSLVTSVINWAIIFILRG